MVFQRLHFQKKRASTMAVFFQESTGWMVNIQKTTFRWLMGRNFFQDLEGSKRIGLKICWLYIYICCNCRYIYIDTYNMTHYASKSLEPPQQNWAANIETIWGWRSCGLFVGYPKNWHYGWSTYPPPQRTPRRNNDLIAGLINGNQWLSQALIIKPAISGGGYVGGVVDQP